MDENGDSTDMFLGSLGETTSKASPSLSESIAPPISLRRKTSMLSGITSITESALSVVETGLQASNYVVSRFMGQTPPLPPMQKPDPPEQPILKSRPPWQNVFAVLKHKSLFIYSSDERLECLDVLLLPDFRVDLWPEKVKDSEIFNRDTPIRLRLRYEADIQTKRRGLAKHLKSENSHHDQIFSEKPEAGFYLYLLTGSDKEDWYLMLRRTSLLQSYADSGALSTHFEETPEFIHFKEGMKKLYSDLGNPSDPATHATAWLNAILGRAFVGLHANPKIKDWLIRKLSRRTAAKARERSFLGDIVIQDVSVGNSLPILSNPRLLDFTVDGDLNVEVDIDYTGM
jgi:hypothetical protein